MRTMPPDLAEFHDDVDELKARRSFMVSRGYRFCMIPACNCNSWHHGHSELRLNEIKDMLDRYDVLRYGITLLDAIEDLVLAAGYKD